MENAQTASTPPDRVLDGQQQAERLRVALSNMPGKRRQAFLLFKYRNLSRAEIAVELGLSIDAVEKHLVRALRNCRDALERGGGSVTNIKNTDVGDGVSSASALAFIENKEQLNLSDASPIESEVDPAWGEVWNSLDLLAEVEFPELVAFDEKVDPSNLQAFNVKKSFNYKLLATPRYWGAIAAILLIALLVPITYVGVPVDYVVDRGQQKDVILKDGTSIVLGSHTQASVREGWGQRAVTLHYGSAFFAVAPNKNKPFAITAGTSTVSVLGTAFSVYHNNQRVEVVVESGKVNFSDVSNDHQGPINVNLTNNQKAIVKRGEALQLDDNIIVEDAMAWRRGSVHFKQESLENIVSRMSDFYETPIYIKSTRLRRLRLSGVFKTDDIDNLLVGIQAIADVRIERNTGGAVYIY